MNTPDPSQPRPDALACRAAGLHLRGKDAAALSRWIADRVRALALAGADHYAALLAEDSAAGQRERERLTVRFSTGETYYFRDQSRFDLLACTILPQRIRRRSAERWSSRHIGDCDAS